MCQQCSGGMYCPFYNATSPYLPCAAGYFCKSGSNSAKPESGHTGIAGPCTRGNYCPSNTTNPIPCPAGTYSNITHLKLRDNCTLCQNGHYCAGTGLTDVSGPCNAGYYCKEGSSTKTPDTVTVSGGPCTVGHYCPNRTTNPIPCPPGTYNNVTGQAECQKCCASYYCSQKTTECTNLCPKGKYCPENTGTPLDCPKGTYNAFFGKQSLSECVPCEPGKYCPTSGLEVPYGNCSEGWYCKRGAWSNKPNDIGNFTNDTCYCSNKSTGGQCQKGYYCPVGSENPRACDPGKIYFFSDFLIERY